MKRARTRMGPIEGALRRAVVEGVIEVTDRRRVPIARLLALGWVSAVPGNPGEYMPTPAGRLAHARGEALNAATRAKARVVTSRYEVRPLLEYQRNGRGTNVVRDQWCIVHHHPSGSIGEVVGPSGRPSRFRSQETANRRAEELEARAPKGSP